MGFRKVFDDCCSENDGKSYDLPRVAAFFMVFTGFPTFLALVAYSVYANTDHHFDMIAFGTAFGAILSGVAMVTGSIAFKQRTDTQGNQQ